MMIEILKQGKNDGVIHCRSKETGTWLGHFKSHLQLDPERVHELFLLGSIYDDKKRLNDWSFLESVQTAGSYVRIHTEPRRYDLSRIKTENLNLHEDSEFLVTQKPPGIPCHPTVDNQIENFICLLEKLRQEKLYLTHRLDLGTQGLLLIAKTPQSQKQINLALSLRRIEKKYRAWTENPAHFASPLRLLHWMHISPKAPKSVSKEEFADGLRCELEILKCQNHELEIRLITGRTHQIRAQLSDVGFPIWGDLAYGAQKLTWGPDHWALQAFQLQLPEEIQARENFFEIPAPAEILEQFSSLV